MPDIDDIRASSLWQTLHGHPEWVAAAIALLAFIECFAIVGLIVPGVVLLYAAAFLAGGGELGLWWALGCAFAGAVAGDSASYLLGRRFGPAIRVLPPFANHPEWITRGEGFFLRHGAAGIALGRFVGPIRPILPLIAGMLSFPVLRFHVVNVGSALLWAPAYILPGFLLGASLQHAIDPPPGLIVGLLIFLIWCWGMGRLTAAVWQAGEPGGALFERLDASHASGRILRAPAFGSGVDTRLSVLAGTATLLGLSALGLVLLLASPTLAPWRRFGLDLLAVLRQLL